MGGWKGVDPHWLGSGGCRGFAIDGGRPLLVA